MRGNLPAREPERVAQWAEAKVYAQAQKKNKEAGGKKFILHDGPPFTNGNLHLGHALNKTLKDTILRYKSARGFVTPYYPGWDCHGLPIEHKVSKDFQAENKTVSTQELRDACEAFSEKYIAIQREQFQRLGVLADWEKEYKTKNPAYEAKILDTFASFVEKGLVYRSKKPVYWSIPCQTALAEAEIEYREHTSPSIYVAFKLDAEGQQKLGCEDAAVIIWTTTPWTIPANLAIAVHPQVQYDVVQTNRGTFIIAHDLVEKVSATCEFENVTVLKSFTGEELSGVKTRHPFIDRASPIITADYVTTESGTGCVHTAPGHGLDDYLSGLKYGLDIYCPLDDNACYVDDGQIPAELVGLSMLEVKGRSAANKGVLQILEGNGSLLKRVSHQHSYPHCWRSKTPVIFRAMDQWFVSLDEANTRQKALSALDEVQFHPAWGKNRIQGFVENRPDWCISRQRSWGVPIPVFYNEEGEALLDAAVIRALAQKVATSGTAIWFTLSEKELLRDITLPEGWSAEQLKKGRDTLDVWIDSGCSHRAVLEGNDELSWPADLYLEGSDQHRGWFQSSLWTGIIAKENPPYKNVLTHGFIVKEDGTKLSKSDPDNRSLLEWINQFGADVVRLWICSQDYRGDVPVSENIFKNVSQSYRSLRNTLRFQVGNLHDFSSEDAVSWDDLDAVDQWAWHKTVLMLEEVEQFFENYEFHRAIQVILNYVSNTLSATYHDILKDRLYTFAPNDPLRRSSQTTINHIFQVLVKVLGPIVPFTADEAWAYYKEDKDFSHDALLLQPWVASSELPRFAQVAADVDVLLSIKANFSNDVLESLRQKKEIGQSLDAQIHFKGSSADSFFQTLQRFSTSLAEIFIVSQVSLETVSDEPVDTSGNSLTVSASHADGYRCPRSWKWVPALERTDKWGEVSPHSKEALAQLNLL